VSDHTDNGIQSLISSLDEAVRLADIQAITQSIKKKLGDLCTCRDLSLPGHYTECSDSSYARRLLHHDPELNYTVVVMTWGPGQGTALHDHAGMWCVECVVEGELDVTQYDLHEEQDGRCRFTCSQRTKTGIGDAGCLIPPYEYHVLANANGDRKAVTLHVYGGEMDHCNVYEPAEDGWWARRSRSLSYNT
jgi:predicted metal-dependent enzyme (double-stranded beta helix superfamily)